MSNLIKLISVLILSLVLPAFSLSAQSADSALQTLIDQAGNTSDEGERVKILNQIENFNDASIELKIDVKKLTLTAKRWSNTKDWRDEQKEEVPSTEACGDIQPNSKVYLIACLYEARSLTWLAVEGMDDPAIDKAALKRARHLFELIIKTYPQNQIVRMYLGELFPNKKIYKHDSNAPEWANLQREGLERLADIVEWWIDNRMRSDNSYGGGWGDDCEMWRWWEPLLIGFFDPKIEKAQAHFSETLLKQPYLSQGYYSRKLTDVEHSAEDLSDALTPLMHLDPSDRRWKSKALKLVGLMRDVWTGRNAKGFLQFKSTYFTANEVSKEPAQACDTVYHPRSIRPALLYWQRTGDPEVGSLVLDWLRTWVAATKSSERGKPVGVIPSAIHWPDGNIGGTGPDWWNPKNHSEEALYAWPSAAEIMSETLLLGYSMSKDETFLEPLRSMAAIRLNYLKNAKKVQTASGSKDWCAEKMDFLGSALAKFAIMTGTHEFDEYLKSDRSPYTLLRLFGDESLLLKKLTTNVEALKFNFATYTSEVRFTDRVLHFPRLYRKGNMMFGKPVEGHEQPEPSVLYSMATGDPGSSGYFPMNAVRWMTPPRDIAALVTAADEKTFAAKLWHFGTKPRSLGMQLYRLVPGNYWLTVDGKRQRISFKKTNSALEITIPSQKLVGIQIIPVN